ncbi:hypothetical protein [Virgibacillus sp. DJP39]
MFGLDNLLIVNLTMLLASSVVNAIQSMIIFKELKNKYVSN